MKFSRSNREMDMHCLAVLLLLTKHFHGEVDKNVHELLHKHLEQFSGDHVQDWI
jgi:hypothetical protein